MRRKNLSLDDAVAAVDGFPGRVDGGRQDLAPVDHLDERHAPARGIEHLDIESSFAADRFSRLFRGVDGEDEFEVLRHLMVALLVAVALILAGVGYRVTACRDGCQVRDGKVKRMSMASGHCAGFWRCSHEGRLKTVNLPRNCPGR